VDTKNTIKPVRITDQEALKLLHERAPEQHRSLANLAAVAVIQTLSGSNNIDDRSQNQELTDKGKD
jgi:hypothetical protein